MCSIWIVLAMNLNWEQSSKVAQRYNVERPPVRWRQQAGASRLANSGKPRLPLCICHFECQPHVPTVTLTAPRVFSGEYTRTTHYATGHSGIVWNFTLRYLNRNPVDGYVSYAGFKKLNLITDSVAVSAEISCRSPWKLFISNIKENICRVKVSKITTT